MSSERRRRWLQWAAATAATAAAGAPVGAFAQSYPSRAVRLVVGASPGGPSDFLARMMADLFGPALGQGFVVENRPGASGVPAADVVAKAPADGHTLLVSGPASIAVASHLNPRIPYDPMADFVPVCMLGAGAFAVVAHPSLGAQTMPDLIAAAKARPGAVAYGSGGNGSSGHLCTELFASLTGVKMLHVPYKGDGQAVNDLLSGQIQVMFTAPNVVMPHVKSGRLKLLAVTSRERPASLPDTPTVHEAAVRDFEYLGWIIVFAPAATPRPVIDTLAAAWQKVRGSPAVLTKLEGLAMSAPERLSGTRVLADFVRTEHARLGKVIRDAGIRADA